MFVSVFMRCLLVRSVYVCVLGAFSGMSDASCVLSGEYNEHDKVQNSNLPFYRERKLQRKRDHQFSISDSTQHVKCY